MALLEGEGRKERIANEIKSGMVKLGACRNPSEVSVGWTVDPRLLGNSMRPRLTVHLDRAEEMREDFPAELAEIQIPGILTHYAFKEGVTEPRVRPGKVDVVGRFY